MNKINLFKNITLFSAFVVILFTFQISFADSQLVVSSPESIAVLQSRVDTLQSLNQSILNSVYWTLGILATIFLALISVNLYFNISANKREIEKIKKDFTDNAKNAILASESKILEKISALNQKEFDNIKSDILATAKNEVLASESKILEKISALNQKEFDNIKSDILATAKNEVLASETKVFEKINSIDKTKTAENENIKREVYSLKDALDDLDTKVKEFEIDKFAEKGQQGEIIRMIDLLQKSIDKKKYDIPERLVKIRDYLKNTEIRAYVSTDLNKQLSKIENNEENKFLVKEIRDNIKIFVD